MNFQDLLTKIRNIDDGKLIEECGMPMPLPGMSIGMPRPEQADSVTMNVSMNGSGAGGIRDLMGILKNIEDGGDSMGPADAHDDDEIIIGSTGKFDSQMRELEDSYANEPNPTSTGTNIVDGDDLNEPKKSFSGKPYRGDNPMQEALVSRLSGLYQEIKEAGDKKTMSRAAKGNEKYGKDGMKALAKAGREGKSLEPIKAKYNKYD